MPRLNWGIIQDGGCFESLTHDILYAEDPGTVLFGRPGPDAGQDARSADGVKVYQAKYRQNLNMDKAISLALAELEEIRKYRQSTHSNYVHWKDATQWILAANLTINPNDDRKWQEKVVPKFADEGLSAHYWDIETLEGKLVEYPDVRDVFFEGENRVLVGLKEAYDLLAAECIGRSDTFDVPMVGRGRELEQIRQFANDGSQRLLPVVGAGGVGKSRLLYEGLAALAQEGWRVLWALPGSMGQSSRWFQLLNSNRPTCVALDAPGSPALVRAVVEQLATTERQSWKVIISCRPEQKGVLRRFERHAGCAAAVELDRLDEPQSKELLRSLLPDNPADAWCHRVHSFTDGYPSWLCMVAQWAAGRSGDALPAELDTVAEAYVDSCLQVLDAQQREPARTVLRWLSLWGRMTVESGSTDLDAIRFLENKLPPSCAVRTLLTDLAATRLVRNWGMRKRLFAVKPLVVREHILSSWLLEGEESGFRVNHEGEQLVGQLVAGEIPSAESILKSLSRLSYSRLGSRQSYSFLQPVFGEMKRVAESGTTVQQRRILSLVQATGLSDPESALDVLIAIRENPKPDEKVSVPIWGDQTFTHAQTMAKIPWELFQIAECATASVAVSRVLSEFRELVESEERGDFSADSGKGPTHLLKRLLCKSENSSAFVHAAAASVRKELEAETPVRSTSLVTMVESLLNPVREFHQWVADWTLSFGRGAIAPGNAEWGMAQELRERIISLLRVPGDADLRFWLWDALAKSHHDYHYEGTHGSVRGDAARSYRELLANDLGHARAILSERVGTIGLAEATYARKLWKWYLDYGKEDDAALKTIAEECETLFNQTSDWRLQDFFKFENDERMRPETERIASRLREASDAAPYAEFFSVTGDYLRAVRARHDAADSMRIRDLAIELADEFDPDADQSTSLTDFVIGVLADNPRAWPDGFDWEFAICICEKHVADAKREGNGAVALRTVLKLTASKGIALYSLYSCPHPKSVGELSEEELEIAADHLREILETWRRAGILGSFAQPFWGHVKPLMDDMLQTGDDVSMRNQCMRAFVRAAYVSVLRYKWAPEQSLVQWIVDVTARFDLDGDILGMHELDEIRKRNGDYRMSIAEMTVFLRRRMEREGQVERSSSFDPVPYDFRIVDWCAFDPTVAGAQEDFNAFCSLALGNTFLALSWMPKYVAQLDPSGTCTAFFVSAHISASDLLDADALSRLGYLAAVHPPESQAWAAVAAPICRAAQVLPRDEREHVYFGLSRKESASCTAPGQVAECHVRARDTAKRLLDAEPHDSPLREYREWALEWAEDYLKHEQERVEELFSD